MNEQGVYLRAILATVARQTFPPERLAEIVGTGKKQLAAYNMFDGTKGQGEVAKDLGIDAGNMSRTVSRWLEAGIAVRVGDGRDSRIVHLYPLPQRFLKKGTTEDGE